MGLLWSCCSCQSLKGDGHQHPDSVTLAVLKPQCVKLIQVHPQECWLKVLLMEVFFSRKCLFNKNFFSGMYQFPFFPTGNLFSCFIFMRLKVLFWLYWFVFKQGSQNINNKLMPLRFTLNKELGGRFRWGLLLWHSAQWQLVHPLKEKYCGIWELHLLYCYIFWIVVWNRNQWQIANILAFILNCKHVYWINFADCL